MGKSPEALNKRPGAPRREVGKVNTSLQGGMILSASQGLRTTLKKQPAILILGDLGDLEKVRRGSCPQDDDHQIGKRLINISSTSQSPNSNS